jgi:hypothetical protein
LDKKEEIIAAIKTLAERNGGVPPGRGQFTNETGIQMHEWRGRYWARWGDAVSEAGLARNRPHDKLGKEAVLQALVSVVRHFGHLPTVAEMKLLRRQDATALSANTLHIYFRSKAEWAAALRDYCRERANCQDVLMLCGGADDSPAPSSVAATEGFVYLLKSGKFYKIGRSENVEQRVKQIQISLPEDLTLVHAIRTDDPSGIEAYWHNRFANRRAKGEWFQLSASDLAAFKKRRFQ